MKGTAGKLGGILVVGDWVIDEDWVVGDHRTTSSKRAGPRHSLALHSLATSVRSLCGAGQVATIINQAAGDDGEPLASVAGVGVWHPRDDAALAEMLDPSQTIGSTPLRVSTTQNSPVEACRLYNLLKHSKPGDTDVGTTRIVRIYQHSGSRPEPVRRIDWERPITDSVAAEIREHVDENLSGLPELDPPIAHVVIADLCRGAVTEDLIIWLSKKFSHAKWYLYSKAWKPSWFRSKAVSGLDVRVVLVPSLAASAAVRDPEVSLSSWVTPQGSVSQAALSEVEDLSKSFPRARVVVLPQDMRVLAYDGTTRRGWVQPDTGLPDPQLFTPMATVFFPALVLGEILAEAKTAKDWIAPIRRALEFTHAWIDAEVGRLMTETWNPPLTQRFSVASRDSSATFPNWQPCVGLASRA